MNKVDALLTAIGLKEETPVDQRVAFLRKLAELAGYEAPNLDSIRNKIEVLRRSEDEVAKHASDQGRAVFHKQISDYSEALARGGPTPQLRTREEIDRLHQLTCDTAKAVVRSIRQSARAEAKPIANQFVTDYLQPKADEMANDEKDRCAHYGVPFEPSPLLLRIRGAIEEVNRAPDVGHTIGQMLPFLDL